MGQVQNFVDEGVDWKGLGVVDAEDELPFADEPQSGSDLVAVEAKPAIIYIDPANMPDLDKMDEGINIESQYWEVRTPGETKRGVLVGWSEFNGKNGPVDQVIMQNKDGIWRCAGANLVQQMRPLPLGTAVQVTFMGEEKTGKGYKVNKFTVKLLNQKPALNLPEMDLKPGGVPIPSHQR
jgi:hypothetical protein